MNQQEFFEKLRKNEFTGNEFYLCDLINELEEISDDGKVYNFASEKCLREIQDFIKGRQNLRTEINCVKISDSMEKYQLGIYKNN